jgi:hypothetical protein
MAYRLGSLESVPRYWQLLAWSVTRPAPELGGAAPDPRLRRGIGGVQSAPGANERLTAHRPLHVAVTIPADARIHKVMLHPNGPDRCRPPNELMRSSSPPGTRTPSPRFTVATRAR